MNSLWCTWASLTLFVWYQFEHQGICFSRSTHRACLSFANMKSQKSTRLIDNDLKSLDDSEAGDILELEGNQVKG